MTLLVLVFIVLVLSLLGEMGLGDRMEGVADFLIKLAEAIVVMIENWLGLLGLMLAFVAELWF